MKDKEKIIAYENALNLIRMIAIDYDGFSTEESLKGLIDELKDIAAEALKKGNRL